MKTSILAAAALALLAAAAPATDWTRRVTQTAQGAFVLGNPAAKQRLVEYVSYTCDHCAHFVNDASAPLKSRFVASGGTAVEVRHAVRDPIDLTATLLARCTGPGRFFAAHERLFATQPEWLKRGADYIDANRDALNKAGITDRLKLIATGAGLGKVVGLNPAQVNSCLADPAQQKPVMDMTDEAWRTRSIPGTPHFLLNGQAVEQITTWEGLEPRLISTK